MARAFVLPGQQIMQLTGVPYSGARAFFYVAGTTTPQNVYSDAALTIPLSQPVVADSSGRWVQIYMQTLTYRIDIYTSASVLIASYDNVDGGLPIGSAALPISAGGTGATTVAGALINLGISPSAGFSANKNGTDQTGVVASTFTKVTFTTEQFDTGAYYDAPNSKWTPPSGLVQISVSLLFLAAPAHVVGAAHQCIVYKNGVLFKQGVDIVVAVGDTPNPRLAFTDSANGTDFYEVYTFTGSVNQSINGASTATFFTGSTL